MLKPEYNRQEITRIHTRMIAILAEVGAAQGYGIWIGRREQGDPLSEAFPGRKGELRQYITRSSLTGLVNVPNTEEVEWIDLLWLEGDLVKTVFEIESTTSMTEALKRGSNIERSVPKYLVLPQEREDQLSRKLRSPLFSEHFAKDSWRCLFFEALERAYQKEKGALDITSLVAKKVAKTSRNAPQLSLFGQEQPQDEDC
jgi:hypothetical protein